MNGKIHTMTLEPGSQVKLRDQCNCSRDFSQWRDGCYHDLGTIRTIYSQRVSNLLYKTDAPVVTALVENKRGLVQVFAIQELTLE